MSDGAGAGAAAGASGSQGAGGTGSPPPIVTQDWTSNLNDDLKGYVTTKGFKDPGAVVDSYRNLEKLHGVPPERLMKIPEKLEGDDAKSVFQRLGMPKEAKDYNVQIPKEMGDEKLGDWIREVAFKNNFTNRQAEGLVKEWTERMTKAQEEAVSKTKIAQDSLQKEWGPAFEQNKNLADQGARAIGMNQDQVQALGSALGPDGAMKLLHKIATATGEASFISGQNPGSTTNTPDGAKAKIEALIKDASFNSRLKSGDNDAKREWDRLHVEWAGGQMVTL